MLLKYESLVLINKRGNATGIQLYVPEVRVIQPQESTDYHLMYYPVGY